MRRIAPARALLCLAALGPLAVLAGCGQDGGVRVEGNAPAAVVPSTPPSPSPAATVDPVALLRRDPKVSAAVKADLKPCGGDEYPVDTSYGELTGGPRPDLVVNVSTCGDGVGLAGYVYRVVDGGYVDVFGDESTPVYLDIAQGQLELTRQIYSRSDAVCCPSGEDVYLYRWSGHRFRLVGPPTRNEYGAGDDG